MGFENWGSCVDRPTLQQSVRAVSEPTGVCSSVSECVVEERGEFINRPQRDCLVGFDPAVYLSSLRVYIRLSKLGQPFTAMFA